LFEAAACATPVISDAWDGIDELFEPGREIILARTSDEVTARLSSKTDASAIGRAARSRILAAHTSAHRAAELEQYIEEAAHDPARPELIAAAE
jgi:spore maturation protein CgeB